METKRDTQMEKQREKHKWIDKETERLIYKREEKEKVDTRRREGELERQKDRESINGQTEKCIVRKMERLRDVEID